MQSYWGSTTHHHAGYIDEFRIWKGRRTAEQIRAFMHTRPSASDSTLLVYYDFDQTILDRTVSASATDRVIGVRDLSTRHSDLLFGACTPNTAEFCYTGAGTCSDSSEPKRNCWGEGRRLESAMPQVVPSKAPIGSRPVSVTVKQQEKARVFLQGRDMDMEWTGECFTASWCS